MTEVTQVVGVSVAVTTAMVGGGLFVLRAVIARDIKPLSDAMIALTGKIEGLSKAIDDEREARKEERDETRAILRDLDTLVRGHETTLGQHAIRLDRLDGPPPQVAARKRRA